MIRRLMHVLIKYFERNDNQSFRTITQDIAQQPAIKKLKQPSQQFLYKLLHFIH